LHYPICSKIGATHENTLGYGNKKITLNNSQNPRDWFKTHWMNIEIKISNISMPQPMFKE